MDERRSRMPRFHFAVVKCLCVCGCTGVGSGWDWCGMAVE